MTDTARVLAPDAAPPDQRQRDACAGPPQAALGFEAAYDAYGPMVYRLAMVYLGSRTDAEDVVQEAFVRLLRRPAAVADGEHEKRWLLRVAVNLCRDQLKGFWRRRAVELEPGLPAEEAESLGLAEAIVALPERYKGPIHLHSCEGYSVAEVGEILKLGQSAVKMRLKRGRELLRKEMEGQR